MSVKTRLYPAQVVDHSRLLPDFKRVGVRIPGFLHRARVVGTIDGAQRIIDVTAFGRRKASS